MASAGDEIRRVLDVFGPIPKEIRAETRTVVRLVAGPVLDRAQVNAAWSKKIPAAMRLTTSFSQRSAGAAITVSRRRAPNARPFENLGRDGTFRHPVWGHRDRWVAQVARPSLFPAVKGADPDLVRETGRVVEEVFRKHGFR